MNLDQSSTESSTVTAAESSTESATDSGKVARKTRKRDTKNLWFRDGIWYFKKIVNGKREFNGRVTPFTLETGDYHIAKAKRDKILAAASGAEMDRVLGRESRTPATLGQIWTAYEKAPTVRANSTTRKHNWNDLKRMVRVMKGAHLTDEQIAAVSSSELTKQFVKDWQAAKLEEARIECKDDLAKMEAAKRSINSLLTHVQSIFSREARDDYGKLYLPPCVLEFATAFPVKARKQEEPKQLKDDFVAGLLAALPALQTVDAGAWAAFQLMMWGGLRNKECVHAQTDWLELTPAGYKIHMKPTAGFLPKGRSRHTILPLDVGAALLTQVPNDPKDKGNKPRHLVPATSKTDRDNACYRRLNEWLKAQGVTEDANKIAYRLRKWFLNKVLEEQGIRFAQAAAGHAHVSTLQDHYTGAPKMAEPIKFKAVN